jgi:hypothetical protein
MRDLTDVLVVCRVVEAIGSWPLSFFAPIENDGITASAYSFCWWFWIPISLVSWTFYLFPSVTMHDTSEKHC